MKSFNSGELMSAIDDSDDCRSLVCDAKGVIIAETVYRCVVCAKVSDCIRDAKTHYNDHIRDELCERNDDEEEDDGGQLPISYRNNKNNNNNVDATSKRKSSSTQSMTIANDDDDDELNAYSCRKKARTISDSETFTSRNGQVNITLDVDVQPENLSLKKSSEDYESNGNGNDWPNVTTNVSIARGTTTGAVGKSGYISCAVCGVIRFYSCIYRRYGQFTCQVCYRFFRTFFIKPKKYFCRNLGKCPLNVRIRCRACWIKSCIGLYAVDDNRQKILDAFRPEEDETSNRVKDNDQQSSIVLAIDSSESQKLYKYSSNQANGLTPSPSSTPILNGQLSKLNSNFSN